MINITLSIDSTPKGAYTGTNMIQVFLNAPVYYYYYGNSKRNAAGGV